MSKKNISSKKAKKKIQPPQLLRGMKDIYDQDQVWFQEIRRAVAVFARDFGFSRIDTPILEQHSLFVRAVGDQTDVVQKEMYAFVDQGGEHIAARPEATASIVRAYIEHGMLSKPQPVKLYYEGPMFRHERPQLGRFRQFFQFGFETLGDQHPVLDAEMILVGVRLFQSLGLQVVLQINSIGDENCRPQYTHLLKSYFRTNKASLCEDCQKRLLKNPLRVLDCKEAGCITIAKDAPQTIDHLCTGCKDHFVQVLEYLDELQINYELNPRLVRGLDYYTKTVFEYWFDDDRFRDKLALGGGGRYDRLAELLGGRKVPAVGMAPGFERIVLLLNELKTHEPKVHTPQVFVAPLGDQARKRALKLYDDLRAAGVRVAQNFPKDGLASHLGMADKLRAQFTLIIGQQEILDDTVMVRDMETSSQEVVGYDKIVADIKKRLRKK